MVITPELRCGLALQVNWHHDQFGKLVCSTALPGVHALTLPILGVDCCFYESPSELLGFCHLSRIPKCLSVCLQFQDIQPLLKCLLVLQCVGTAWEVCSIWGPLYNWFAHALEVRHILNSDFAAHTLKFNPHVHNSSNASGIHQAPCTCKHVWAVLVWRKITGLE